MKDIKPIRGKFYIHRLIEEGEHEHQDFKYAISDARKIARSISAFANNDGGRLLVGVKDNGHIVGIPNEEDIFMIEHAAQSYCVPPQNVEMTTYTVEGGAVVLQASIAKAMNRPVYCVEEGARHVAYYRIGDENIVAHPLMVRSWELRESENPMFLPLVDLNMLQYIRDNSPCTPEESMLALHLSRDVAESIVTKLLALGMVEMVHFPDGFRLRQTEE